MVLPRKTMVLPRKTMVLPRKNNCLPRKTMVSPLKILVFPSKKTLSFWQQAWSGGFHCRVGSLQGSLKPRWFSRRSQSLKSSGSWQTKRLVKVLVFSAPNDWF